MPLKSLLLPLVWATSLTLAGTNTAPTVVIQSAAMRPGTTLMDVVYRVNDPDDATVKTRALAFVDGVRYRISYSMSLVTWFELPDSSRTGTNTEVKITDPATGAAGKFFQVEGDTP
jgi:hypothetical protein